MCLIIHNIDGREISPHILENAFSTNPDGFGITFLDTLETVKTMEEKKARKLLEGSRPYVAHFRYATRGHISKGNCHPFPVHHKSGIFQLYANGTVGTLGCEEKTDTQVVADMLAETPRSYWKHILSMTETRFAIVSPSGHVEKSGIWHERDGLFYSKANCFAEKKSDFLYSWEKRSYRDWEGDINPDETGIDWKGDWEEGRDWRDWAEYEEDDLSLPVGDLVAVYGTLKKGRGNHRVLGNAWHIGDGLTCEKYLMADHGVPYVYPKTLQGQDGGRIVVELYKPRDIGTWQALDCLEGHPDHYCREMIAVETEGEIVNAWLYFAGHDPSPEDKFITEY